jgi:malate dehydrogenase
MMVGLGGVVMELEDSSFPLLAGVVTTHKVDEAFRDVDACIMLGAFPRKEGMERKDLLAKNAGIFKEQGGAINSFAKRNVKVLVVGNPANTNALLCKTFAPEIPAKNFTCLTRLDHNRAKGQVAIKAGVNVAHVKNVSIWGNHSSTQYPDVNHGSVKKGSVQVPIRDAVHDDAYLNGDFISTVQKRGAAVIAARKFSSAFSAARAITDHMRDWFSGTPSGEFVSMGVFLEAPLYGIPAGLIYSMPVTCSGGEWTIVRDLAVDAFSRGKMDATAAELIEERDAAMSVIA